jgi:undecaprenyl-diphosphatase
VLVKQHLLRQATTFELYKKGAALGEGQGIDVAGDFAVSFVIAYVEIRQFPVIVARHGLRPFGLYRIAAGLLLIGWLFLG